MNRYGPREGYTEDFVRRREAAQRQAEYERLEAQRLNEEARQRWLAKVEADREAQRARDQAAVDAQLAPTKERLKRQWLADHPEADAETFERRAWPQLKANLLDDLREQQTRQAMERMRASGEYNRF
jgi:hypothetical protein